MSIEPLVNQIIHDDCINVLKKLPEDSIHLIITDPPYGVNYKGGYDDSRETVLSNIDPWLSALYRVLKQNAHMYIFIPTIEADEWISTIKKYFNFNNLIATRCYQTNNQVSKNNFTFDLQLIAYASKGKAKPFNKVDWIPTSPSWLRDKRNKNPHKYTYQYPSFIPPHLGRANTKPNNHKKRFHPNEKNISLIMKYIYLSSEINDIVLDPFAGSGSTAIASWKCSRRFIVIEEKSKYYASAKDRLKKIMTVRTLDSFMIEDGQ